MLKLINSGETVVTLQEKVDGVNLGFSLSPDGREILVQNRSYYIRSGDHAQFGRLTAWIEIHRQALLRILDASNKRNPRHATRWLRLK
jgi:hypothetical protein